MVEPGICSNETGFYFYDVEDQESMYYGPFGSRIVAKYELGLQLAARKAAKL